jgi:UDP-4-amino-4,6-dideoxy-N-acetyl-beta-L-altrosamine transaminase
VINYGRQEINQDDIDAVISVLESDFLTQGHMVPKFQEALSAFTGAKYSIVANSATSALHIACLALDLKKGDTVWTSPNSFVASANCAIYCGAMIDFVDIDHKTYNMSVDHLEAKLLNAEHTNSLPKVVIPVHYAGQPCDMKAIFLLSKKYGFKIIEDASHAIGSTYRGRHIGSCEYSDITVFSFHPVKIITTGEGGAALTNNSQIAKKMMMYRSHGISSLTSDFYPTPDTEIWNYQQIRLGFNYRMTDIQAALGLSQIARISEFVAGRKAIAEIYDRELSNLPAVLPYQYPDCKSSYHLYPIKIKLDEVKKSQKTIFNELLQSQIGVNIHYIPIYRQPFYEKLGFKKGYCPVAEEYYRSTLSIPIYPSLTRIQQDYVINALKKVLTA